MGFVEILLKPSSPLGRFAAVEELGSILAIKEMREIQEDQTHSCVFKLSGKTPKVLH